MLAVAACAKPALAPEGGPPGQVERVCSRMWHAYVANICSDVWRLTETMTDGVMRRIEDLVDNGRATDEALIALLTEAGVQPSQAEIAAPTIRAAIKA